MENGKYRGKARSTQAALIESGKGTPGIAVDMVFSDPALAGQSLTWTGWLSDGAFDRTVEALRAMGWTGNDLDNVTGLDTNEVELVVEAEEYEGNWYPRIKFVNKLGGVMGSPMDAGKAKSFAAAMRDRIRALDASKGQAKPAGQAQQSGQRRAPAAASNARPPARPEPPPHDDMDIPF